MRYKLHPAAYQRCPYRDSRSHADKPINVESLRSLVRRQEEVLVFIGDIARYLRTHAAVAADCSGLSTMHALSYIGYKSPQIFFMKKILDELGEVPAILAIAARFFHGLVNVLALMALNQEGWPEGREIAANDIYRYAERNGHLVGKSESCAASSATIIRYLTAIHHSCCGHGVADFSEQYSGALPVGTVESVCHGARITMELELCCLIYETVRCKFWRQIPADNTVQAHGHEPISSFATTHCLVARKISLAERPFDHVLFSRAYHLARPLLINHERVDRMIGLAIEAVNTCPSDRQQRDKQRAHVKAALLDRFDDHTDFLARQVKQGACLSADLDVFFGKWPGI